MTESHSRPVARQTGSKIRGSYDVFCDQVRDFSSVDFLGSVYQLQSREHPRKCRGKVFNVAYYSVAALLIYCILLFLASSAVSFFTGKNRFSLSFQTVLLADILFLYAMLEGSSLLFLTENSSTVSVGGSQGELVRNGLKTILGWRDAAENAISGIRFAIALHFLFSIHNYMAARTELPGRP